MPPASGVGTHRPLCCRGHRGLLCCRRHRALMCGAGVARACVARGRVASGRAESCKCTVLRIGRISPLARERSHVILARHIPNQPKTKCHGEGAPLCLPSEGGCLRSSSPHTHPQKTFRGGGAKLKGQPRSTDKPLLSVHGTQEITHKKEGIPTILGHNPFPTPKIILLVA